MLSKENRLKKDKEFNYIYKKGKYINSPNFTVYYVDTMLKFPKFGVSVNKKVGNSVVRSRTKRIMNEVIRLNLPKLVKKNYVIVLKPGFENMTYKDVEIAFLEMLKKAKLVKREDNV